MSSNAPTSFTSSQKANIVLSILCILCVGAAITFLVLWLSSSNNCPECPTCTKCPTCPECEQCSECPTCAECLTQVVSTPILFNTPYLLKTRDTFARFPDTPGLVTISSCTSIIMLEDPNNPTSMGPVKAAQLVKLKSVQTGQTAYTSSDVVSVGPVFSLFSFRDIQNTDSITPMQTNVPYVWNNEDDASSSKGSLGAVGSMSNQIGTQADESLTWILISI